jgi:hypothetical protein
LSRFVRLHERSQNCINGNPTGNEVASLNLVKRALERDLMRIKAG